MAVSAKMVVFAFFCNNCNTFSNLFCWDKKFLIFLNVVTLADVNVQDCRKRLSGAVFLPFLPGFFPEPFFPLFFFLWLFLVLFRFFFFILRLLFLEFLNLFFPFPNFFFLFSVFFFRSLLFFSCAFLFLLTLPIFVIFFVFFLFPFDIFRFFLEFPDISLRPESALREPLTSRDSLDDSSAKADEMAIAKMQRVIATFMSVLD